MRRDGRIGALALTGALLIALALMGIASRVPVVDDYETRAWAAARDHIERCRYCSRVRPPIRTVADPIRGLPCARWTAMRRLPQP